MGETIGATLDQCATLNAETNFPHFIYVPVTLTYNNTLHPINNVPSPNDPGDPARDDQTVDVTAKGNLFYAPAHSTMGGSIGFPTFFQIPPSMGGILAASGSAQGLGTGGNLPSFFIHASISAGFRFQQSEPLVGIQSSFVVPMNFHQQVDGSASTITVADVVIVPFQGNNSAKSTTNITLELGRPVVRRQLSIPHRSIFNA
jgi:hypothetical protein